MVSPDAAGLSALSVVPRWKRGLTFVIDQAVIYAACVALFAEFCVVLGMLEASRGVVVLGTLEELRVIDADACPTGPWLCLLGVLAAFMYYFVLETLSQRTVGKLVVGTKVLADNGSAPRLGQVALRTISRFVPIEPVSGLGRSEGPAAWWHDRWSHTVVVSTKGPAAARLPPEPHPQGVDPPGRDGHLD